MTFEDLLDPNFVLLSTTAMFDRATGTPLTAPTSHSTDSHLHLLAGASEHLGASGQ